MELLIVGAGGHGRVAAETAAACGYDRVAFLDDNSPEAVGKLDDLEHLASQFSHAFVGIGNNNLRGLLLERLEQAGYKLPVLIHPTAYVSPSAQIGMGTIVEPKALVNANSRIGKGCIISVGAIVDHDTVLGDCVHANAGSIVMSGATMEPLTKLDAGQIAAGYSQK